MEIPAISVVIPLYNAKEYIGECLDSILAQTFQKFEVIVVDDCSKDGSVALVESYASKFDGRLRVMKTKKNSGGGGYIPRNIGLNLANGEYIFFADADDYLAKNALETLYTAATKNNADVVYTAAYYELNEENKFHILRDEKGKKLQRKGGEDKAELVTDDPEKILSELFMEGGFQSPWTKFVRRDFLTDNELFFPEIVTGGDYIWSINVFSKAKRFLRLPVPLYFFRSYSLSFALRKERRPQKQVSFWVTAFVSWLKALNDLTKQNELLAKNPAWCYKASSDYFKYCLGWMSDEILNRFYSKDTYEILLREFAKANDSTALMVPFFFSAITNREKLAVKTQKRVDKLEDEVTQQKKQIGSLTTQTERVKELEGTVTQQKKQIDTLTTQAGRVKTLEGTISQQKKQIDTLTTQANRVKELEETIDQQRMQIDSMTTTGSADVAVSVIIPMYNAEEFIGEALESLYNQTLKNIEVIVVNDCSKDNCCAVVEGFIPQFEGRLKLYHMPKNSGAAPAPRNKGFLCSHGRYIFFMDVDDVLTETALEEMYTLAQDYGADVVYCERYYMSTGTGKEFMDNVHVADKLMQHKPFVDKPTFISDDLTERIHELAQKKFWVTPWQRFVARDLLAENRITFPEIIGSDDVVWCLQVLCCAKKFLRVPNICYIRRMSDESFTKAKKAPNRHIKQWMDVTIRGLKFVDNFLNRLGLFQDDPATRYEICHLLSNPAFFMISDVCAPLTPEEIYDIFQKEFLNDTGENNAMVAYACTRICLQDKTLKENKEKLKQAADDAKNDKQRIEELEAEIERLKKENADLVVAAQPKLLRTAVSVIIPLYNAEEFIAECLDSLLIQTFQDFEVIVVDDCSTDNGVKIVEEYAPKFNGRLKMAKTKQNSHGGGYVPRNIGVKLASGEYIYFADADDFLLGTALETFYNLAKEYDTDIIYTAAHYQFDRPNEAFVLKDGKGRKMAKEGLEYKQTLIVDEPEKNLDMLIIDRGFTTPWSKFIRREFLIKNEISFPEIAKAGDHIWTIDLYCHARRVLWYPKPLYFYRKYNMGSISRVKRTPSEQVTYWVSSFVEWLKTLQELADKSEILKKNPAYCYEASKRDFDWLLRCLTEELSKSSNEDIYEILYREFSKSDAMSINLAVPFFFTVIDTEKKNRKDNLKTIDKLKKENEQLKKAKK